MLCKERWNVCDQISKSSLIELLYAAKFSYFLQHLLCKSSSIYLLSINCNDDDPSPITNYCLLRGVGRVLKTESSNCFVFAIPCFYGNRFVFRSKVWNGHEESKTDRLYSDSSGPVQASHGYLSNFWRNRYVVHLGRKDFKDRFRFFS